MTREQRLKAARSEIMYNTVMDHLSLRFNEHGQSGNAKQRNYADVFNGIAKIAKAMAELHKPKPNFPPGAPDFHTGGIVVGDGKEYIINPDKTRTYNYTL